jgi:hypothetical protein
MKEELLPDNFSTFDCLACQRKAHHPVLTRCAHLFWYIHKHLVGNAIIKPPTKIHSALSVKNPPLNKKFIRSSSKINHNNPKMSIYLIALSPKTCLK